MICYLLFVVVCLSFFCLLLLFRVVVPPVVTDLFDCFIIYLLISLVRSLFRFCCRCFCSLCYLLISCVRCFRYVCVVVM